MGAGTAMAAMSWVIVLYSINPFEAGVLGLVFFYSTLFLSLVGLLSLFGIAYRILIKKRSVSSLPREVKISFRHSMLLAILGIGSLILASQKQMTWYFVLLLFVLIFGIEYVSLLAENGRRK